MFLALYIFLADLSLSRMSMDLLRFLTKVGLLELSWSFDVLGDLVGGDAEEVDDVSLELGVVEPDEPRLAGEEASSFITSGSSESE